MPITILSASTALDLQDARALIARLEDAFDGKLRGKLQTARELLEEVENEAADQGLPL